MFKLLFLLAISILSAACQHPASASNMEGVHLLGANTLKIVGVIEERSALAYIESLTKSKEKRTLTIYIDSPGGNVMDGNRMIEQTRAHKKAKKLTTVCLIQEAASMAFAFVQAACDHRVIQETSILMQHQMSFGVRDSIEKIASMVTLARAIYNNLNAVQARRLGLKIEDFKEKISNDWYLVGQDALTAKAADFIGSWICLEIGRAHV